MSWIMFGVGVVTMCLCVVSGRESRREEQREHDRC